jgi:hypothetical protein
VTTVFVEMDCPTGEIALGGGYSILPQQFADSPFSFTIDFNLPIVDVTGVARSWFVEGGSKSLASVELHGYAQCAKQS